MNRYLNSQEKAQIKNAIKDIESKSSAEIVVAVTNSVKNFDYFTFLYSLFFTFICSFILILLKPGITSMFLVETIIAIFLFVLFILSNSTLMHYISPKFIKKIRCNKLALYQFRKIGVNKKSNHKAILIFVCLKSRFIRITADSQIDKIITHKTWQEIINSFISKAKNEKIAEGILEIIDNCGDILINNFPKTSESKDELSNEVIEV